MRGMQLSPGAGSPPGPPDLEDDEGLKHLQQVWGGGEGWRRASKALGTLPCREQKVLVLSVLDQVPTFSPSCPQCSDLIS